MFGRRRIGTRSSNRLRNKRVLRSRSGNKESRCSKAKIDICANKKERLSTKTFDNYKRALWEKLPSSKKSGCVYVEPLWYSVYRRKCSEGKYRSIKTVSREENFQSRYIFLPICESNHWNLLIICNIGEDIHSESTRPCMLLLDSLQALGADRNEPELRKLLYEIYEGTMGADYDEIMNIPFRIPKIPQQKDGEKCGHYVLYYMYKFLLECPHRFNISEDYPGFMNEEWFNEDELEEFFEKLVVEEESEDDIEAEKEKHDEKISKNVKEINQTEVAVEIGTSTPPENDLFVPSDALRALVIYTTPDSSQPESSQEMLRWNDVKKDASVSLITESDFGKKAPRRVRVKVRAKQPSSPPSPPTEMLKTVPADEESKKEASVSLINASEFEKKAPRRVTIKLREKRTSPRLSAAKTNTNDQAQKSPVDDGDTVDDAAFNEPENIQVSKVKKRKKQVQAQTIAKKKKKGDSSTIISDDDSDFEKSMPKKARETSKGKKRKDRVQRSEEKVKKTKKGVEKENNTEEPEKVNIRAYPSTFTMVVEGLSPAQKEWVTTAGFGDLLSFSMMGKAFPHFLAVNCLWWYDHNSGFMSLHPNRKLQVTEEDVVDVLGLPRGELDVSFEGDNERMSQWKEQFPGKQASRITEKEVRDKIEQSTVADENFKQNFMVLMTNLFIKSNKTSFVCPKVLKFCGNYDNARNYNWCKPVIEGLKTSHESWWINTHTQFYTGSLVFLLYFYLTRTENRLVTVEETYPAFHGWLYSRVKDRDRAEKLNRSFGKGEIVEIKKPRKEETFEQNDKEIDDLDGEKLAVDNEEPVEQEENFEQKGEEFVEPDDEEVAVDHEEPVEQFGEFEIEQTTKEDKVSLQQVVAEVFRDVDSSWKSAEKENEANVHAGIFAENEFGYGDDFRTPNETIKGVQKTLNFSQEDQVNNAIMSITREIENEHDASDNISEKEMLSRVEQGFDELQKVKKTCIDTLAKARELFPNNELLKEYAQKLVKMDDQFSSTGEESEWPYFTKKDWKTFDILTLPEHDRAFNKLVDIDDFLGELYIGGEIVHDDLFARKSTRVVEFGENKLRREQKVGEFQKSPFLNRTIDFNRPKFTKDEEGVWNWINGTRQGAMDEIFFWNGCTCYKHHIQSLQLEKQVISNVVDVYTCILNEDEKFRSVNSPRRFFCNTMTTMGNVIGGAKNDNYLNFMKFRLNLDSVLQKHKVNIIDVDLIFFPIYNASHHYIICFNLRNVGVEIIDNRFGGDIISFYDGIPESLRENLSKYMLDHSPRKSQQISNATITLLQMKWRTKNKNVESGVFAMNHMETYMGNGLKTWECKFLPEIDNMQKKQLQRARQIYAARIIYSPINYFKDKMFEKIKSMNEQLT